MKDTLLLISEYFGCGLLAFAIRRLAAHHQNAPTREGRLLVRCFTRYFGRYITLGSRR